MAAFSLESSLGMIFALIGNPIGGAISDKTNVRFGRRRTWILIGSTISAICLLLIGFAPNVGQVVVLWCIAQFFFNFSMAAYTALIPDQVEEDKRGSMSGIFGLMPTIFMFLGMLLITAMGEAPMEAKWGVVAFFAFVGPAISCFIIKDGKVELPVAETKVEKIPLSEKISKIYPSPRKFPEFTYAIGLKFFIMAACSSLMLMSVMFIDNLGMTDQEASVAVTSVMMFSTFAMIVSGPLGGYLSDKFKKQKVFLYMSAAFVGFGLIIFAFASSSALIIIGATIVGFGQGCFLSVDTALVARILPRPEDSAKDFGLMNVANTLPGSLVPAIMAPLVAILGWSGFYLFLAIGVLGAVFCLSRIPEVGEKTSREKLAEAVELNEIEEDETEGFSTI